MKSTNVSEEDLKKYEKYKAYYVEISGDLKYDEDNRVFKVFIIVKENNVWKISNILTPIISQIYEEGVAFYSRAEQEEMNWQIQASKMAVNDFSVKESAATASTPWYTAPQNITVYFTKNENIQHFGKTTASIDFHEYIKNVVPEEWIVSYYGQYPTYLQAGVMACKMFGWYHTVYPAYQFAPYYADVKDNGDSQNFLYNSYSKMLSKYQGYLNNAMNFARNLVMVTEKTNELFLVQYRSDSGSIHSGYLNQAEALELAKQGMGAVEILNTYLGSTPFTRGQMIKLIPCGE